MSRAMQSVYMHWAKNQAPVRYHLASSEVPHFALDRLPLGIADLSLDGASRHRYAPLREAIAARQGVAADQVVIANGTSMANFLAMAALITPGDEVLVETPAYEPMVAAASFLGGQIVEFSRAPADGFRLDPAALDAAITPRTRLIVVTNLHNPTSAFADAATLVEIGRIAERNGARVLVDEVYLDAAFAEAPRTAAQLGETFVATSSLTKIYGLSGIRCGWILAAPDFAERMWRLNELMGVAQPHAAELLGVLALTQQFTELATKAMKDGGTEASRQIGQLGGALVKQSVKQSVETAGGALKKAAGVAGNVAGNVAGTLAAAPVKAAARARRR